MGFVWSVNSMESKRPRASRGINLPDECGLKSSQHPNATPVITAAMKLSELWLMEDAGESHLSLCGAWLCTVVYGHALGLTSKTPYLTSSPSTPVWKGFLPIQRHLLAWTEKPNKTQIPLQGFIAGLRRDTLPTSDPDEGREEGAKSVLTSGPPNPVT